MPVERAPAGEQHHPRSLAALTGQAQRPGHGKGPPPSRWPGGWASPGPCHLGAEAATGSHLLFLDADTWLAPDALDRLVAEHAPAGGLLSVQPHHVTEQPYEQLSAVFNLVAMMGTGAFTPRPSSSSAAAIGPCLLTSVTDYEAGPHGDGALLEPLRSGVGRRRPRGRGGAGRDAQTDRVWARFGSLDGR